MIIRATDQALRLASHHCIIPLLSHLWQQTAPMTLLFQKLKYPKLTTVKELVLSSSR